jgi:hypothetical protein
MDVPGNKRKALREAMAAVGYRYWEETENAAYKAYLGR